MQGMQYLNGNLIISNGSNTMTIPCSNEFAGRIMNALRVSKQSPIDAFGKDEAKSREIGKLMSKNNKDSVTKALELEGYVEVGDFGDGVLYAGFMDIGTGKLDLLSFTYVSHRLPNTHGNTHVNITFDSNNL